MAFVVPCPKCSIRLKCGKQLPAGCRLTCPSCRHTFVTQEEAEPFAVSLGRKRQAEIPAAIILEEEPESDRPPIEPRKRPRIKPRRESPPQKPRLSPAVFVGLAIAGFAFALAAGIVVYFVVQKPSGSAPDELLVHVPSDAIILSGYDLEALGADGAFRRAMEKRAPGDLVELDRAGLRSADVSRVLVARTVNNGNTCVVRFKEPQDRAKYLRDDLAGKPYGSFTSVAGRYRFGYFDDPKTLVLADREQAVQTLKEKGRTVRVPTDLKQMADKVRGPIWRVTGRISDADHSRIATGDDGVAIRVGPSAGTAAWGVPEDGLVTVQFELAFATQAETSQGAGTLRALFTNMGSPNEFGPFTGREGMDPADISYVRRGYEQAEVSEAGNTVTARLRVPAWEAIRVIGSVRNK